MFKDHSEAHIYADADSPRFRLHDGTEESQSWMEAFANKVHFLSYHHLCEVGARFLKAEKEALAACQYSSPLHKRGIESIERAISVAARTASEGVDPYTREGARLMVDEAQFDAWEEGREKFWQIFIGEVPEGGGQCLVSPTRRPPTLADTKGKRILSERLEEADRFAEADNRLWNLVMEIRGFTRRWKHSQRYEVLCEMVALHFENGASWTLNASDFAIWQSVKDQFWADWELVEKASLPEGRGDLFTGPSMPCNRAEESPTISGATPQPATPPQEVKAAEDASPSPADLSQLESLLGVKVERPKKK